MAALTAVYLSNLRDVLAALFPTVADSLPVLADASMPTRHIAFSASAINNWQAILDEAAKRGKVFTLASVAAAHYPEHPWLAAAVRGDLTAVRGPDTLQWHPQPEALTGKQPTFLPIAWLLRGYERAKAVARVDMGDGGAGSGWLTHSDLFVTNHHVLPAPSDARAARVQFFYETDELGRQREVQTFLLDPDNFFVTSQEADCTLVRLAGRPLAKMGIAPIPLGGGDPPKVGGYVHIVQHPGGGLKQVALHHNTITYCDDTIVQYLTDTLPGSSGSPVFDSAWNVVAIHHSGGWHDDPSAAGQVYRNEGIALPQILKTAGKAYGEQTRE